MKAEEQAQAKHEAQVESRPAEDLKPAEDLFAGMDVGASELVQVETTAKAEPSDYVEAQSRSCRSKPDLPRLKPPRRKPTC